MLAKIITYDDRFGHLDRVEFAYRNPSFAGDRTVPKSDVAPSVEVIARVNYSRWIADCPDPDCDGAEYVSFKSPFFFCHGCRNAAVDHCLIRVKLPSEKARVQIETYLIARKVPATRNWFPGESVKAIRDENREHGLRIP